MSLHGRGRATGTAGASLSAAMGKPEGDGRETRESKAGVIVWWCGWELALAVWVVGRQRGEEGREGGRAGERRSFVARFRRPQNENRNWMDD